MFISRSLQASHRQHILRNAKFLGSRTDAARRFGVWDEFKKDKSFQEFGEEMSKARQRFEEKAAEAKDKAEEAGIPGKTTEFVEGASSRFGRFSQTISKTGSRVSQSFKRIKITRKGSVDGEAVESEQTMETVHTNDGETSKIKRSFSSVKEYTTSATKRMGEARKRASEKLKLKTKLNVATPKINLDPEEQKRKIQEMYSSASSTTAESVADMFSKSGLKEKFVKNETDSEPSKSTSKFPKIFMVSGCVGGASPCNGFYRLQATEVNERPVYMGPKLESGEFVHMWHHADSNKWIFTPGNVVNTEEYEDNTSMAYCEDDAAMPLEISGQWHVQSRRPGRYLPHGGLTVTNELPSTPPPEDALVVFEAELSWFQQHARRFQSTRGYKKFQTYTSKVRKTEHYRKVAAAGDKVKERYREIHEEFEESQSPLVHSIRNKIDYVSMETEYGAGINAIRRDYDEDFWPEDFIEYAETDIIPKFVDKYLEGDMSWLRLACDGEAERACFASCKERMAQEHHWDTTVLWIHEPILEAVLYENKKAYVRFSVSVQHVDCSRNAKGEIVDGGPSKIVNTYLALAVTPFPENMDKVGFPWRIEQLVTQRMHAIV